MKKSLSVFLALCLLLFSFSACESTQNNVAEPSGSTEKAAVLTESTKGDEIPAEKVDGTTEKSSADEKLRVDFIDVGQADSILVSYGDEFMLIDGGNAADGDAVVSYLKSRGVKTLSYVVNTHPHEDHVGGLAAVLSSFSFEKVFASKATSNTKTYESFKKAVKNGGGKISYPVPGEQFTLGKVVFTVLGPITADNEDKNNSSVVLKAVFGESSFLFMGDAELAEETEIIEAGADLKCDVLKIGHHGSDSSTGYRLLREASPSYAVISVGKDNTYGHPADGVISKLGDAEVSAYRTDLCGTIVAVSDGKIIKLSSRKSALQGSDKPVTVTSEKGALSGNNMFIGNINSKVLHIPSCGHLPKESNRIYFADKDDAFEKGYKPCSFCMK